MGGGSGDLLKLGIDVGQTSVAKYRRGGPAAVPGLDGLPVFVVNEVLGESAFD